MRVAVLGAGAWGSAFGKVLADAGSTVRLWDRDPRIVAQVNERHVNDERLPGLPLPTGIVATGDRREALQDAELVVCAISAQVAREALTPFASLMPSGAIAVSLMKGIELATDRTMSQVVSETLGVPPERLAVVSGPNLAREIARQNPTATVVASPSEETARRVVRACANDYFRPYASTDVLGVELCGALKNVVALAVGMARGKGFGDNTAATLVTRGLAEITRLGIALGARAETFAGLAGVGDLMATCASPLSRNSALGMRLGQGMSLAEAVRISEGVAEGVKSSRAAVDLARRADVEMPISEAVVQVLYEGLTVEDMVRQLLSRPTKNEASGEVLA